MIVKISFTLEVLSLESLQAIIDDWAKLQVRDKSDLSPISRLDNPKEVHANRQPKFMVALSGGIDSMVLLHLLSQARQKYSFQMIAVHINHQLRANADSDAEFVQSVCNRWEIECVVKRIFLDSLPVESRKGTEADARQMRYEALWDVAHQVGAPIVVTAHHSDDQIETILWRLLRGTTLTGLKGMKPTQSALGKTLARPLLSAPKSAITEYAVNHKIPYVEDETNQNDEYIRNRLRHHVIPQLKCIQPDLLSLTTRMTEILREEDTYLEQLANRHVVESTRFDANEAVLFVDKWLDTPLPLQRRAIQIILYWIMPEDWTFAHIESILGLLSQSSPSVSITLPKGIIARRNYAELRIGNTGAGQPVAFADVHWPVVSTPTISVGDEFSWHWDFFASQDSFVQSIHKATKWECFIPLTKNVTVRGLDTAERVLLFGGNGHRKVQDVFVDAKVPKGWRNYWPGLVIDDSLVWIPGIFRSGHFKLADSDANCIHLRAVPPQSVRNYFFGHRGASLDV